ncbi:MAG: glycine cleavage system protein GcvH [Ktedonobacterales bacterium]
MADAAQPQGTPQSTHFARTHEWARVEGDEATIGISDFAQDELGDVVYLDLPWDEAGGAREIRAGEHFGDIESVKATSELFSPVSGTLVRVNEALKDHAELVNSDSFGEGWMIVVRLSNPAELNDLMDEDAYKEFTASGGH